MPSGKGKLYVSCSFCIFLADDKGLHEESGSSEFTSERSSEYSFVEFWCHPFSLANSDKDCIYHILRFELRGFQSESVPISSQSQR